MYQTSDFFLVGGGHRNYGTSLADRNGDVAVDQSRRLCLLQDLLDTAGNLGFAIAYRSS